MPPVTRLLINKRQITETRLDISDPVALVAGQVRLRIDRFSMTSNNISYAATGEQLRYWSFFPADVEWGCLPTWGFATVVETTLPDLPLGERIWGFLPFATEVVLQPVLLNAASFIDGAAHRRALPMVYNQYMRCAIDPLHKDGQEDIEALLRPLFSTGWLIDSYLFDNTFFDARVAVLSSASSKTAYSTAFLLARRAGIEVIGLTAAKNIAFVKSLGCYDKVIGYDQLGDLEADAASVFLDYAGNAGLRREIHTRLKQLRHSSLIGASHVDQTGSSADLPGPKPAFLFLPTQAAKCIGEWGVDGLMLRIARDWRDFVSRATDPDPPWIVVQRHQGVAAATEAYALVARGGSDPRTGHMLSLLEPA